MKTTGRRHIVATATCTLTALAAPPGLLAQEDGGILDEIVVTAQRRAEPLQKVPLAVSAYSGEQL